MREDQAKSPEATASSTCTTEFRNEDLVGISNNDLLDLSTSIDEEAYLPTTFAANFTETPCRLWIDKGILGQASAVKALEGLCLVGFKPLCVAVDLRDDSGS